MKHLAFLLVCSLTAVGQAAPSCAITSLSWNASSCSLDIGWDHDDDGNQVSYVLYVYDDQNNELDSVSLNYSAGLQSESETIDVSSINGLCDAYQCRIAMDDGGGHPYTTWGYSGFFGISGTRHSNCGCSGGGGGGGGGAGGGTEPYMDACLSGADLYIEITAPTPSDVIGWTIENETSGEFDFTQATTPLGDGEGSGEYVANLPAGVQVGDSIMLHWQDSSQVVHDVGPISVQQCTSDPDSSCGCFANFEEGTFENFEEEADGDRDGDGCKDKDDPEPDDPDIGCIEKDYDHPTDDEFDNKYLNIPDIWDTVKQVIPDAMIAVPVGFGCRDYVINFAWQTDPPLEQLSFNFEWHTLPNWSHDFGGGSTANAVAWFDAFRLIIKNLAFFSITIMYGKLVFRTLRQY